MIWPPKWLQTFGRGMRLVSGEVGVLDALFLSQMSINKVCLIINEVRNHLFTKPGSGRSTINRHSRLWCLCKSRRHQPRAALLLQTPEAIEHASQGLRRRAIEVQHRLSPYSKKHPTMKGELCVNAPLLTCLSPAEQDFLSKI